MTTEQQAMATVMAYMNQAALELAKEQGATTMEEIEIVLSDLGKVTKRAMELQAKFVANLIEQKDEFCSHVYAKCRA
jgi:hypothetical protein